jgi:5-methylcytosine-specific restriction protein A
MSRTVKEWIGKTDDEPFPDRVRIRILRRFNYHCAKCTRVIVPGQVWTCDHVIALINGGENRESNGQPLCEFCNPQKNAEDVAIKSKTYDMARAAYGLKKAKARPMDGARNSPWKKKMDGSVERRIP